MSSLTSRQQALGAWLLTAGMVLMGIWYAHNQLLYSLYFFYQVASYFYPGLFPPVK